MPVSKSHVLWLGWIAALAAGGWAWTTKGTHEQLHAVAWIQTAEEWEGICRGTWRAARTGFDRGFDEPWWTAAPEQAASGRDLSKLPRAVIVDVDETVLDNSPYQARLIEDGQRYGAETWAEWVREAAAEAVPGALPFLSYAAGRGATVFYVTNRTADLEEPTRKNLRALGFPLARGMDVVLCKGEKPGWGSIKTPRRELIAATHRVVVMVGDDLGDFIGGDKYARAHRRAEVDAHNAWWGERWFCLPNPAYGSWVSAVFEGRRDLGAAKELEKLMGALRPKR